jgi:hypothetical protein
MTMGLRRRMRLPPLPALLLGLVLLSVQPRPGHGQESSIPQAENCGDAEGSSGYKTAAAINEAVAAGGTVAICPNAVLDDDALRPTVDGTVILCAATTTTASSCVLTKGIVMDADDIRVSIVGITFADFDEPAVSGSAGATSTLELRQVVFQVRRYTCLA